MRNKPTNKTNIPGGVILEFGDTDAEAFIDVKVRVKQLVTQLEQIGCACDLLYGIGPCGIHAKAREALNLIDQTGE